jgi:hypothetical protein
MKKHQGFSFRLYGMLLKIKGIFAPLKIFIQQQKAQHAFNTTSNFARS